MIEQQRPDGSWPRVYVEREWGDFRLGDHIDALDTQSKWYESEILEIRVFQEEITEIKVHYIGWAHRWDEWIVREDWENRLGACKKKKEKEKKKALFDLRSVSFFPLFLALSPLLSLSLSVCSFFLLLDL